ncbi:ABC transporter permease subunit, partial [Streptomyces eurythermus]|uniref:ABC transporter permease subunit n=1 Tax=Streptomyces eurythermus TaxID=42237 RepID=UPI0033C31E2C
MPADGAGCVPDRDDLRLLVIGHAGFPEESAGSVARVRSAARPAAAAGFPKELIEAASLDGAGRWTILWRIILPMSW